VNRNYSGTAKPYYQSLTVRWRRSKLQKGVKTGQQNGIGEVTILIKENRRKKRRNGKGKKMKTNKETLAQEGDVFQLNKGLR